MVKSIIISAVVHLVLFGVILVGFPVHILDNRVPFYYIGSEVRNIQNDKVAPKVDLPIKIGGGDEDWSKGFNFDKPKR